MTEAERALGKIVRICEQADKDPEPLWGLYGPEIETVARMYFLDQLSKESHEFEEPPSEAVYYVWWQRLLHAAGLYRRQA